jgi:plastocyanin
MTNKHIRLLVMVLTVLALGSILFVACSRPGTTPVTNTGSTPSSGGGEPTVHMNDNNFVQPTVTVPKGQKLKLVDDSSALHILANGMWDSNGTQKPLNEPGAPKLNNLQVTGNSTVEIGPFTTAGTFHIFCTIHPGMNLTVTVK